MKKIVYSIIFTTTALFTQNISAQIPTNGLVGKYTFTGNANDEAGTNNGTVNGATLTTDRFGSANSAYSFDGIDDYIQMNNATQFGTTPFTISFWYKKSSTTGGTNLINNLSGNTGFSIGFNGDILQYYVGGATSGSRGGTAGTPSSDTWHHIVLVHNFNTRLYVDGVQQPANINTIFGGVNGTNISIAKSGSVYLNCSFDDLLIYNRELSQAEITELYNAIDENCIVNIPDTNFKNYLVNNASIDTNGDNEIQCLEAIAFTGELNLSNLNISDLTGIQSFTKITGLNVDNNNLTSLNVTENTALTNLNVAHNNLSSLNVNANTALTSLNIANNNLASLNVNANTALTSLNVAHNNLTSLDVNANTALTSLNIANNNLTSLNLNANTALTSLNIANNNLTSLNVNANTALTSLNVAHNNLSSLNVNTNTALKSLNASNNNLRILNVNANTALTNLQCNDNQLNTLTVANGNNTNFTQLLAQNNPALNCIYVDDAAYSTANWTGANFQKDAGASYCDSNCVVNIPDANFKNALLSHNPVIDTNGDGQIQCLEAALFTGSLFIFSKMIADPTGIEAFRNITQLDIRNNLLTTLDVSNNMAIAYLRVSNNASLTSLNLGNNTMLNQLEANACQLVTLDVSDNTGLTIISANNNQLTSLDISNNPNITQVSAANNQLTSVNLANGNNANFTLVNLQNNPANLFCIKVDNTAYSTTNWTGGNFLKPTGAVWSEDCSQYSCIVNIPNANFKTALLNHNPVIDTNGDGHIQCSEAQAYTGVLNLYNKNINNLTGIEAFTNISALDIQFNPVGGDLDLSNHTSITELHATSTNITSLNLGNNPVIHKILVLQCMSLQSLDVSNNPSVTYIHAYLTGLTSLNVANGNNTNFIHLRTDSSNLTCIKVDNAAYSNANWVGSSFQKPAGAVWSEDCSGTMSVSNINKKQITIYPNPVKDVLNFSEEVYNVKITDLSGRTVKNFSSSSKIFNVSHLPKGTYIITANTKMGNTINQKMIKE